MKQNKKLLILSISSVAMLLTSCNAASNSSSVEDFSSVSSSNQLSTSTISQSNSSKESKFSSSSSASNSTAASSSNSSLSSSSISSSSIQEKDELEEIYSSYKAKIDDELPVIKINTANLDWLTKYNRNSKLNNQIEYVSATISTSSNDAKYNLNNVSASVKVRGNYTLDYSKKPIRIKFSEKQKMLGLNNDYKSKSWVLLADWKDLSMQNNSTYWYLGNVLGRRDNLYCTDFRNVELYVNNQYWGMYLLAEQQQVASKRVNVTEPEGTELDIGYLVEYDGYYVYEDPAKGGDYTFTCNYNNNKMHTRSGNTYSPYNIGYSIKSDINSQQQVTQISNYVNNVYKIAYEAVNNNIFYEMSSDYSSIKAGNFANSYDCVSKVINVESLADAYILNNIACDDDIASSSFYISCDLNHDAYKPLTFEAPWDKDSAFGIKVHKEATGDIAGECENPWLTLLAGVDWFDDICIQRWTELKKYGVLDQSLKDIKTRQSKYKKYYEKNFEKWSERIRDGNFELYPELNSYKSESEAADYLYNWLTKRYKYLDSFFEVDNSKEFMKDAKVYRYEVEDGELTGEAEIKTGNNSSNNKYVGQISTAAGNNNMILTVNAAETAEVYIYIGCSKMNTKLTLADWFDIKINGEYKTVYPTPIPQLGPNDEQWHAWISLKACHATLSKGKNLVEICTKSTTFTNVDYIDIYSKIALS